MGRERRIRVLYKDVKVVVMPLQIFELKGIAVKTRGLSKCKCVPLLVSYYLHILEGRGRSAVRHDVAVKRPGAKCTVR